MSVSETASNGDRVATLRELRDRLAAEIETASARDLAPLARQFREVLDRLAELDPPKSKEVSKLDEITARRAARKAAPARRGRAGSGR